MGGVKQAKNKNGSEMDNISKKIEESAIIQVIPAYDTGLSNRMTLKVQVSHRTTARDVINLVVQQLNLKLCIKGKKDPTNYNNEKFQNFCLVSIIDKRERCLRDDFKLLSLQDPWRHGEFYIRLKTETLAAIEKSVARQQQHNKSSGSSSAKSSNSRSTRDLNLASGLSSNNTSTASSSLSSVHTSAASSDRTDEQSAQ